MSRITANDLNVVNQWVWALRTEMSEVAQKYGSPGMDETAFLAEECDESGLLWLGELAGLVEDTASVHLSGLTGMPDSPSKHAMIAMSKKSDKSFLGLWSALYKKVVIGTLLGYLHRMRDMSGKPGSAGMALAYEMSVLDAFSRWSDWDHLSEMSEWNVSTYMYEMSPLH